MKKTTDELRKWGLQNRYIALRHGESVANVEKKIVSNPTVGYTTYGLTELGFTQVEEASNKAYLEGLIDKDTIVIFSPFLRTKQTAGRVIGAIKSNIYREDSRLQERFFGSLDMGTNNRYEEIWLRDAQSSFHQHMGVEPVDHVYNRTSKLIVDLEDWYSGKTIILIGHGDSLQILQTWFANVDSSAHRSLPHLETAEFRELTFIRS